MHTDTLALLTISATFVVVYLVNRFADYLATRNV
jgi:hypothetical protein